MTHKTKDSNITVGTVRRVWNKKLKIYLVTAVVVIVGVTLGWWATSSPTKTEPTKANVKPAKPYEPPVQASDPVMEFGS